MDSKLEYSKSNCNWQTLHMSHSNLNNVDWSLIHAFLAVAETGSLSAAARQLNASQPTLGRRIKALEAQLGAELFTRVPDGLRLTETGARLVDPAKTMQAAAQDIALQTAGQQQTLSGTVRITASIAVSLYHLPKILSHIRKQEPEIALELVPSDSTQNLLYREADIAIRMFRPTQGDLIARYLGDIELGVFAADSYIAEHGVPTRETLLDHAFVGYDQDDSIIRGMAEAGIPVTRDFFKTRCDDYATYWELVRAGCGIGFAQAVIGRNDPNVQELPGDMPLPKLPVWLTAHEIMRQTPRIRRVWDLLAEGLKPVLS